MTGLAKRKLPEPVLRVLSDSKVMVLPTRPSHMFWLSVRKVPARPKLLGAVAVKPPAKLRSSDSTPPNCKLPVLFIVTELVTATLPSSFNAKGAAATLKVGVVKPPLKVILDCVLVNTTLVPVVTAAVNVLDSLFTTSTVLRGTSPPTTPPTLMAAVLPPFRLSVRVLGAISPSTVLSKLSSPAACKLTSVNNFTGSRNTKFRLVRTEAPLRCV